jgi:hypothetical protein
MFQINWKLKSALFKILSFLKLYQILFFIQKKITKRSKIHINEIIFYWDYHYKYLKENNSKSVIEIGAGKSLAQNIYLCYKFNQKLEQTLIDISNMLDLDLFNEANEQISRLLGLNNLPKASSLNDLEKYYNIKYLAPMSLEKIAKSKLKYDACISSTTLEHLPLDELKESFVFLKNIIKEDGIISAAIDYSDHYAHTDKNIGNLNYLKFSDEEWKKYNSPMLYQNRLRHQDYREIFKLQGYKIFEIEGAFGESPKIVSTKFNMSNKETLMLWGYFLLKQ